ncbi:hypothetical protein D9M70_556480 [compost metagenome]
MLPAQKRRGNGAASVRVADKATGRVSAADEGMHTTAAALSQKHNATDRAVTANRSDGPAQASNNADESRFLLCAADMMMAALH